MLLTPWNDDRQIYGGLDLSSTTDLTSFAMVQRREDGGWNANWRFWIPEETAAKATRADAVPYLHWEEQGYLTYTPGARIRHEFVQRDIVEECLAHDISMVGYDPWNAEWMQQYLEAEGIEPIKIRQGYASLSEPSKHLEASIASGNFKHGNNPIATWMAENVEVQTDVNANIRPVKPAHGSRKRIDGIVAVIMAIGVAVIAGDDDRTGSYDVAGNLAL